MSEIVFIIGNGESRNGFDLEKLRPHGKIYGCNALYRDFTPDVLTAVDNGIIHEIYNSGFAEHTECWFRNWYKQPANTYESNIYGGLDEDKIKILDQYLTNKNINERGDSTEYVKHGTNYKMMYAIYERHFKTNPKQMDKELNTSGFHVSWIKKDKARSITEIQNGKDLGWSTGPTAAWIAMEQNKPKTLYMIGFDFDSNTGRINNLYKGTKNYYPVSNPKTPDTNWRNQWCKLIEANPNTTFIKVNEGEDETVRTNAPLSDFRKFNNVRYTTYEKCFFNR